MTSLLLGWARQRLSLPALVSISLFGLAAAAIPPAANGIEMFTFYGDGSRIGLPNLEVPVEAYPGIPLRSDRLRARRRAQQTGSAVRLGPTGLPTRPGGIIIRPMPQQPAVPPLPAESP
jgi:hypothetical protein